MQMWNDLIYITKAISNINICFKMSQENLKRFVDCGIQFKKCSQSEKR